MSLIQYGSITGASGTNFSDPTDAPPMTGVFVRTGSIVNCIQAIYGNSPGTRHGDDSGGYEHTINFDADEHLIGVTARLLTSPSGLLTAPTFITNKRSYGPFNGVAGGQVIDLRAQANQRIDGFCGHLAVPGPSWRNWLCALGIGVRNIVDHEAPSATNIAVTGHPQGGSYAEWVQLQNTGSVAVELLGATIRVPNAQRKVVEVGKNVFTFAASKVLAPGESVKVASLTRPGDPTLSFGSELPLFYEQGKDVVELHGADNSLVSTVNIDQ